MCNNVTHRPLKCCTLPPFNMKKKTTPFEVSVISSQYLKRGFPSKLHEQTIATKTCKVPGLQKEQLKGNLSWLHTSPNELTEFKSK